MTIPTPQCLSCRHLNEGLTCAAFPSGIPTPILVNRFAHDNPFPGQEDVSVLYEPTPAASQLHPNAESHLADDPMDANATTIDEPTEENA